LRLQDPYAATATKEIEMTNAKNTSVKILEIARFRPRAGTPVKQLLAEAAGTERFIASQPGFLRRELCQPDAEDGTWVDLVLWEDLASAHAAGEEAMKSPQCAPFFALIDADTVEMQHLTAHTFAR
jgi:hypothetical protein